MYILTTDGLGFWDGRAFDFGVEGSSSQPRAIALALDVNGGLWGAGQRGAWVFDGRAFRTVGRRDGLPTEQFNDVAVDGENRVWFVTNEGISILQQRRGEASVSDNSAR
jgi:ligand-binding sensor domain-containing protein